MKDNALIRKVLCEFLGFLQYKVMHGEFTLEEEQSLLSMLTGVPLVATADDLAGYYGRSPEAVRAVVSRKMMTKPKRRVLYSFNEFQRVAPDKWKK